MNWKKIEGIEDDLGMICSTKLKADILMKKSNMSCVHLSLYGAVKSALCHLTYQMKQQWIGLCSMWTCIFTRLGKAAVGKFRFVSRRSQRETQLVWETELFLSSVAVKRLVS